MRFAPTQTVHVQTAHVQAIRTVGFKLGKNGFPFLGAQLSELSHDGDVCGRLQCDRIRQNFTTLMYLAFLTDLLTFVQRFGKILCFLKNFLC